MRTDILALAALALAAATPAAAQHGAADAGDTLTYELGQPGVRQPELRNRDQVKNALSHAFPREHREQASRAA